MPIQKLFDYLDGQGTSYEVLNHPVDYTAQEAAADTHTPGREFAKTVMLDLGNEGHVMAVAPAVFLLDLEKIRRGLGTLRVQLADESVIRDLCPDCELGAAPPFGNLYDIPVFVDPTLATEEFITFNAGTHARAIRMRYADYEQLVRPILIDMIDPALV